ncbi:MAG: DinB family protein [Candidatus Heimdallarchaeota archaeon]|nr:DinB family protein [Candidatus Heimdallarchaeota archaeon]
MTKELAMEKLIATLRDRRLGIQYILKMVPLEIWDWKPSSEMRSTAELANHLACAPLSLLEGVKGYLGDEQSYIKLEENNLPFNAQGLVKTYDEGLNKLLSYLEAHIDDAHEKTIQFFYQKTKSSLYNEVFGEIGHEWFHLGQLFTYLKQNGVNLDMGAYYGYKDPDPSRYPNS